jgi:hypothetical protein
MGIMMASTQSGRHRENTSLTYELRKKQRLLDFLPDWGLQGTFFLNWISYITPSI